MTAYLGTSGQIIFIDCYPITPKPVGPIVTNINGTNIICPLWTQVSTDLLVRLPDANIQASNSATITVNIPGVTLSPVPVTNNTGIPLTSQIPVDAYKMKLGMNVFTPIYYNTGRLFSDIIRQIGPFTAWGNVPAGSTVQLDRYGFPSAILDFNGLVVPNGTCYANQSSFNKYFGQYLFRWHGSGNAQLTYGINLPLPVVKTGIVDGFVSSICSYTQAQYNQGVLYIFVQPPVDMIEVYPPGTFDYVTMKPFDYFDPNWTQFYSGFDTLRFMNTMGTNNCNVRFRGDFKVADYISDAQYNTYVTGTVTLANSGSSKFMTDYGYTNWAGSVWTVTHNCPGDPFVTGHQLSINGYSNGTVIERLSPTQFNWCSKDPPVVGQQILLKKTQYISIEAIGEICNHYNQNCYINVPPFSDPTATYEMAKRVVRIIKPGLKVYVEYANECWNTVNSATAMCFWWGTQPVSQGGGGLQTWYGPPWGYAKFASIAHGIFRGVFAAEGRSTDLKCVLAWQNGSDPTSLFNYYRSMSSGVNPDCYAVAPYGQGPNMARPNGYDFCLGGANTFSPITPQAILDIHDRSLNSVYGLAYLIPKNAINLPPGVELIAYECGSGIIPGNFQGIISPSGGMYNSTQEQIWINNCQAAQRDPRMIPWHTLHLSLMLDSGFTLSNIFESLGTWNQYGQWASQEYLGQPLSDAPNLAVRLNWLEVIPPQ